jgi:hypothetical protein
MVVVVKSVAGKPGTPQDARDWMLRLAAFHARVGSHYLTYGYGGIPREQGDPWNEARSLSAYGVSPIWGKSRCPTIENDKRWASLAINTATLNGNRCLGRCRSFARKVPRTIVNESGELTDQGLEELELWHKIWKKLPDSMGWPAFYGGYPRRKDGKVYLGEDCRHKSHFDCIGFINWLVYAATGRPAGYCQIDVGQWEQTDKVTPYSAGSVFDVGTFKSCDLLTRSEGRKHMALVVADGADKVIHAYSDSYGVVETTFAKVDYQKRGQIKESFLMQYR